jgi:hypothetical protein
VIIPVIVFQNATANEIQPVKGIDECLARLRRVRKGPNAQFAARNSQVERRSILVNEADVDDCGEGRDKRACDAVGARLCCVRLDLWGNQGIDGLPQ